MHDVNLQNKKGDSIKSLLLENDYIYVDNKFLPNC